MACGAAATLVGACRVRVRTAIITGSGGLIGSEATAHFARAGYRVIGVENDMRAWFFGPEASTAHTTARLERELGDSFASRDLDIRDADAIDSLFAREAGAIELVIHTAAQPSHDWAASDPQVDFGVNANGTLNLLEATRRHAPSATFIFCSTNKVYGDLPNQLPLVELDTRLELPADHRYHAGIDTSMSIDASTHSLFGVSKASADLLVQEYGRYFGMPTVCFRGGCLTGPNHSGTQLHGFLSYLMRCTMTGRPYTVFGYGGKQVRDNIHSARPRRRVRGLPCGAARGRRLQHRRRTGVQLLDARGDRGVRGDRGRATGLDALRRGARRRSPLVDQRPRAVHARPSLLGAAPRHRGRAARDPRCQRRALAGGAVKLSVVIPAHNEADSVGSTIASVTAVLDEAQIDHEVIVVDDASSDGTGGLVRSLAAANPRVRYERSPLPPGFGHAVRHGLSCFSGDAVVIMMADESDSPEDLLAYYEVLEEGYDCAFGTRFGGGGGRRVHGYPPSKLVVNRIANWVIRVLFRHGYNDTTNAFKAYRREVVEQRRAAALQPLQPDGRAAAEGDRPRPLLLDHSDHVA